MTRSRVVVAAAALMAWVAVPATAQVAQPNPWTLAATAAPGGTNINVNALNITPAAGSNRVVVVAAILEANAAGAVTNFNATLGGVALTGLATTEATSARETVKLWYLREAQIPPGSPQLVVTGTHTQTVTGIHVYWSSFSGVFQAAPFVGSNANFNAATSVTFGVPIDYVAGGMTFYVAGNGGATATHAALAGFTQQATSQSNGESSFTQATGVQAASGTFPLGTTVAFAGGTSARSTVAVAALRPIADVAITKADSADPILIGQTTTYTITVTNNGAAVASEVTVTDNLPAGMSYATPAPSQGTCSGTSPMTCSLGTINSGASATITILATGTAVGTVSNTATVAASQGDPNAASNSATQTTTVLPGADLAITKTASPTSIWVGDTVAFSIAVANGGPSNATNVIVTDPLPAGLTLVSATPSQGIPCTGTTTVTCSLGGLASGASASVAIVATGMAAGNQMNTATVAAAEADPNAANNSGSAFTFVTNQTRNADLAVAKSGSPASVAVGANVTYTVTVTNNGPASADDVRLSDPIPAGMTLVSATPSQGSCSGTTLVSCSLGLIANGASATVTIVVMNNSSGRKANTATVQNLNGTEYDPNPVNNVATATTTVTGGAAPLCVLPGKDGAGGTLTGVVNSYYPGTASVAAGATCIPVGTPRAGGGPAVSASDLLLVIQMQDATINTSNTADYGDGPGGADGAGALTVNAGKYEFVSARGAIGTLGCATGVPVTGAGAGGGLLNGYTNANATNAQGQQRFQVVRVPQYTTATLGGVTALPWLTNTAAPVGLGTGGVVAIDVQGTLTVNTGVAATVDGQGFRGAAGRRLTGSAGAGADYRSLSTITTHGGKGESVAGTPQWIYDPAGSHACGGAIGAVPDYFINTQQPNDGYPQGSMARGAPANAGGGSTDGNAGGNDQNSGGGGGSNGGAGGHGGYSWSTVLDYGGRGAAVTPALTQLVLGGGGGAGTRNNDMCPSSVPGDVATAAQEGQASSGAAGGGLMVIRAGQLTANAGAILSANGANAYSDSLNDGGGGGGAGGSVVVAATSGTMAALTIQARGGLGGSSWRLQAPGTPGELTTGGANNRHGPGGGGGGGVVAYTSTPVPPTLDVSGGNSGITTAANSLFGAQAGAIGQTLFAAPGLIPGAGAGSDCSPDLAIALTHNETTVTPGGPATFVATVSNAGPFISSSGLVTVTVTLDPGLLPAGASGSGWTCSVAGQTATCTRSDALAPQLSFPPITVNATVLASGPTTLSNNTATVANTGDVNAANNTATDAVGVRAPTLAHVRQFVAVRSAAGVRLLWRTSYEVNNLGFRVYRESAGIRTLVTPSLVAGSALLAGKQVPLSSGRSYSWLDDSPGEPGDVYWLEDVDLDGTHNWTGPVTPGSLPDSHLAAAGVPDVQSPLLSRLGRARDRRPGRPGPGIGHERHERRAGSAALLEQRRIAATRSAAKLLVPREGWYRVTVDQLRAAGFDPGSNPRALQLFVDGNERALRVDDHGDGMLQGSDAIEFYGLGIDSPYDGERAYWLVNRGEASPRIRAVRPLLGQPPAPASFPFTVERRDRTVTFFALTTNGDAENIFGDAVTADGLSLALDVPHLERTPLWNASLTIALQGVTREAAHDVSVRFNGFEAGSLSFSGQEHFEKTLAVPHEWLREGGNELALVARGAGEDVSLVDYVRLTYAHAYALDGGALRFTAPAGTQVTLRGLADRALRVVDVSDPARPLELCPVFAAAVGETTASVGIPGRGTATLYAFLPANAAAPDAIVPNQPSQWHRPTNQADLVIITHPSLREALQPLVSRREGEGLATALVDVTDVYDEYSYGQRTPYAIRSFLAEAGARWRRSPRYVLLAGDASFDPKNYLGLGDFDLVPTKLVPTAYLKTDSDDWFVDFDLDGLPDLAIGRLPARTAAEASLFVSKILARESALSGGATVPGWARSVLLVSDEPDDFDFDAASAALRRSIPADFAVEQVAVGTAGAGATAQIVSAIDVGKLLVNYAGHGSVDTWTRHGFFGAGDAAELSNGAALPFVTSMTCLNGMFDDVFSESLAETFLKAPNGGAAAVWASSGLTEPEPQSVMNEALFQLLFQGGRVRIGDAVRRAKSAVSSADVRRTWILFGDPTMTLR